MRSKYRTQAVNTGKAYGGERAVRNSDGQAPFKGRPPPDQRPITGQPEPLPPYVGTLGPIPETMQGNGLLLFYGSVLSNWADIRFFSRSDRQWFESSEHYFMWRKAQHFGDKIAAAHMNKHAKFPATLKQIGKQVAGFDREEWKIVCRPIMRQACLMKFGQNHDARQLLLSTAPLKLVEASPTDELWGIKRPITDPRAFIKSEWRGANWLGEELGQVRTTLATPGPFINSGSIDKTLYPDLHHLIHNAPLDL